MLKSLRRRYLALKIDSSKNFGSKVFMNAVWNSVLRLYGEYGASRIGLALIDYDVEKKFAVVRCFNRSVEMVRVAVASIMEIEDAPAAVHVSKVSGTLRSLYEKMKR